MEMSGITLILFPLKCLMKCVGILFLPFQNIQIQKKYNSHQEETYFSRLEMINPHQLQQPFIPPTPPSLPPSSALLGQQQFVPPPSSSSQMTTMNPHHHQHHQQPSLTSSFHVPPSKKEASGTKKKGRPSSKTTTSSATTMNQQQPQTLTSSSGSGMIASSSSSAMTGGEINEGEYSFDLPRTNVLRVIRRVIPEEIALSNDAKLAFAKAAVVFIMYLTAT